MIGEGERIPGMGVQVERMETIRRTIITVDDEEVAHNPLVAAWVEALSNAAKQAHTDVEFIRRTYERPPVNLGYRKIKDNPQA